MTIKADETDSPGSGGLQDWYLTLETSGEAEIKVLSSRFIAFAESCDTIETFTAHLHALKKNHYSATHHCYAYRFGAKGEVFRYSDDGEPTGTAGKRIFGAIERCGLTNVSVVVVRYYGGTKLGTGLLGLTYGEAAHAVLDSIPQKKCYIFRTFQLSFPYDHTSTIHHLAETYGAEILHRDYADRVCYTIQIRLSHYDPFISAVRDHLQQHVLIIDN